MVVTDQGEQYIIYQTIDAFKENEVFGYTFTNEVLTNKVTISFNNDGTGTYIQAAHSVEGTNVFMNSIFVFMKDFFEKEANSDFKNLKILIEEKYK